MNEIRTSGSLLFTEPDSPTRVGEIINTLSEIYDIPMPRLGMSVYVKDEGVNYTITKLEPKLIEGVLVPDAKVAGYELQTGKSIAWNSSSNVNDYVVAGVYNITGERLNVNDGLPIANSNPGHTIAARLVVLDSSIKGAGDSQDKCITQVLTLSNRTGEDGNMYIRTGHGGNINSLSWEPWATLQTNTNVGQVDDLDNLKDNGIYSGVWTKGHYAAYPLTFVCIVINDYFIGIEPRRISQFVYGLSKFDGTVVYQSRVWDDSKNAWGDWEILNHKEIAKMISDEIAKVVADAPETFDTLKEIAEWIENHGTEAAGMLVAINANATAATEIKSKAVHYGTLHATPSSGKVNIGGKSVDGNNTLSVDIPAATTEKAGVMTAEDKTKLDKAQLVESISWQGQDLNDYTTEGTYLLKGTRTSGDNVPIINEGTITARLSVLVTENSGNKVVTQVLTLNNNTGGEGNVYIRSQQAGTWKPWGKLQTNVEVGLIGVGQAQTFDDLTDNGIYSGVNAYWVDQANYVTSAETFVLVVINAYLYGGGVSQLKYSLLLDGTTSVMTRVKNGDSWSEWSKVGKYELPVATTTTLGGIKLGIEFEHDEAGLHINLGSGLQRIHEGGETRIGLSPASTGIIGGVSIGSGVEAEDSGKINVALRNFSGLGYDDDGRVTLLLGTFSEFWNKGNTRGEGILPLVLGSSFSEAFEKAAVGVPLAKDSALEVTSKGVSVKRETEVKSDSTNPVESQAIATAIAEGEKRALRRLFIAAGAEYNDTGADVSKTAPWGETVTHKAGHYYLNGLGDITEEQMIAIYNAGRITSPNPVALYKSVKIRTNIVPNLTGGEGVPLLLNYTMANSSIEVFSGTSSSTIFVSSLDATFFNSTKLSHILKVINVASMVGSLLATFKGASSLTLCKIEKLKKELYLGDSSKISKDSILYTVQKAVPNSAITITLHPDAYTRLADDAEIVAALEAQPLVSLVSA